MLIFSFVALQGQSEKDASNLLKKGRKESMKQKWDNAITAFEELIDKYPGSRYEDDARFWIGYCLEKLPERRQDAFAAYLQLTRDFPNSSWNDDAIIHQIVLAEAFVMEGKEQYRSFLTGQLIHEMADIRHQAALALGRVGDDRALPLLKEMADEEDLEDDVLAVTNQLEQNRFRQNQLQQNPQFGQPGSAFDNFAFRKRSSGQPSIVIEGENTQSKKAKKAPKSDNAFLFFGTKRYDFYRQMLKKDNSWTQQELFDFGLWHILPTDEFAAYRTLSSEYDRSEWLRKFWKRLDPTPTTEENEIKAAFEQRVIYAKANFYEYWNYDHSRYLRDQHIREGWSHAPWDARGEIYIKFGEPSYRSIAARHKELWEYKRYDLSLIITQYMTNIYGNAIKGNTITSYYHRDKRDITRVEANYVYQPDMLYEHDYQVNTIKGLKAEIRNDETSNVAFEYRIPLKQFPRAGDSRKIDYSETYIIMDEDLREISRKETKKTAENTNIIKKDVLETISLDLPPGVYNFACRLDIKDGNKLGIYKSQFTVRK